MIDQHSSLSEKFLKKGFWLYLFSFIIAPIGYIVKIILSGELSVEDVGIIYGIISLITLLSSFSDFGMRESLLYYIPKYFVERNFGKIKTLLLYAFSIQFITSIILACIFFFGSDYLGVYYFKSEESSQVIKVFSLFFLGINTFQLIGNFLLSVQDTFMQKLMEFIRWFFVLIPTLIIFILPYSSLIYYSGVWIIGLYVGIFISCIIFYKKYYTPYLKKAPIEVDILEFKKIISYAFVVFLGAQAATILSQIDMQMIIYLLGTKSAGYYTNYLSIIGIPFILIGPIFAFLLPVFSELYSKKEQHSILKIKKTLQNFTLSLGVCLNIFFFVFAYQIAYILFGEKFLTSGYILQYSVLFLTFNFLLQINFNILAMLGKVKQRLNIILITIVINIVGNYFLIVNLGIIGAAIMTGIGWIIMWILSEVYIGKDMRLTISYNLLIYHILGFSALGMICYYYVIPFMTYEGRLRNLLLLIYIGIIWFGLYVLFNRKLLFSLIKRT